VESYRVFIKKSAVRELEAVAEKKTRQRLVARIRALATKPRPVGCEKLSGRHERYRVRQGSYRIIYSVGDSDQRVEVVKIGHRRDIYRRGD
jgi:mRNA interferase RelE/StbE